MRPQFPSLLVAEFLVPKLQLGTAIAGNAPGLSL